MSGHFTSKETQENGYVRSLYYFCLAIILITALSALLLRNDFNGSLIQWFTDSSQRHDEVLRPIFSSLEFDPGDINPLHPIRATIIVISFLIIGLALLH